jgi:MATE family multidrug resistance protein
MTRSDILSNLFQINLHRKILLIAIPMILSNITTPLMGLVDTAVLGHMSGSVFLAGASVAALIITQLYWLCGFLRMTSTGLSAQARGSKDDNLVNKSLFQSVFISLLLGCMLLLLKDVILGLGLYFADTSPQIKLIITEYFSIRIWGAPAAMANLAVIGWLIGQQNTKQVLIIQVAANLLNVILNLWFVFGLELEVFGVALASVLAEYFIAFSSFIAALRVIGKPIVKKEWLLLSQLKPLLSLNGNTFFRNLMLQACIAFLIFTGVGFGATEAAINAMLMQFFTLIALGLDGVAFAAEALVGEQKGQKNRLGMIQVTLHGLFWSTVLAVLYCLIFLIWVTDIVTVLTNQHHLQTAMNDYFVFVYWLPILGHWCFFFDGVFVGLTRAVAMRNSMFICAVLLFFPAYWLFSEYENQALWMAMLVFLLGRGIILGCYFIYLCQKMRVAV